MAALAGLLVFLLFASGYLPQLQALNIWVLSGLPLLVWVLAFGARAYFFGGALDHYQFLHEQAEAVLRSWQQWAQRSLVVHARCVLIAGLPTCVQARAHTGLRLLLAAMEAIFQKLQPGQTLHVTLLSDVPPDQYEALRSAWQHQWSAVMPHWPAVTLALSAELPYQWIEEKLKSGCPALELIVVLQMEGGAAYSDGLAVLLLGPDGLVQAANLPVQGCLSRPMSLETDKLESELPLFLQTQANMGQVTTLLADSVDWQTLNSKVLAISQRSEERRSKVLAISNAEGVPLSAEQLWILESLCGSPGPFSSWLTAALAVEMTEQLSKGSGRSWISTVTTGEPRCNA